MASVVLVASVVHAVNTQVSEFYQQDSFTEHTSACMGEQMPPARMPVSCGCSFLLRDRSEGTCRSSNSYLLPKM